MASSTLYLVRAPEDKLGFCRCDPGLVNAPFHTTDVYPTGGTGWLFTCLTCHRAFDVAVARHILESLDKLAHDGTPRVQRVIDGKTGKLSENVLMAGPEEWLTAIRPLLEGLVEGQKYVYFDGALLAYRRGPVRFTGLYREHDLPDLPHLAASPLNDILTSSMYWSGAPLDDVLAELGASASGPEPHERATWWRRFLRWVR